MKHKYIFRQITDKAELDQFFRFRYQIYKQSRMKSFLKENEYGVDMDIYDLHSIHCGLFCEEKPIGYLRLVLYKSECYNNLVLALGKEYGIYTDNLHSYPAILKTNYPDFPFLNYPAVPQLMKQYYENSPHKKTGLMEASRLVILAEFRQGYATKFLIECALTIYLFFFKPPKHGVINCIERHLPFYSQYGFSLLEGSEGAYVMGDKLTRVMLLYTGIPQYMISQIEQMTDEFKRTGEITRECENEAGLLSGF